MIERQKILPLVTRHPLTTLQELVRLKPKLTAFLSMIALITRFAAKKLGIKLPPSIIAALNAVAAVLIGGLVFEYKRLLPFNAFSTQDFLRKPKKIVKQHYSHPEPDMTFEYHDGFPVVTMKTSSARERGRLIARIFALQIVEAFDRYYNWLPTAINLVYTGSSLSKTYVLPNRDPKSPLYSMEIEKYLQQKFDEMEFFFPSHILEEFEGIIESLESYIKELNRNSPIKRPIPTIETIKLLAALPDIVKMSPNEIEIAGLHCTAAIRKLPDGVMEHLRTLDYASLGTLTQFTSLYVWLADNDLALASITFLPFAATLSVTNGFLTATINDAATTMTKRFEKRGIPETLCLRIALEECKSFDELNEHFKKYYPATTCSFAISSAIDESGRVYQMLPTDNSNYFTIRSLRDDAVVVTNHHYCSDKVGDHAKVRTKVNPQSINWATTFKREDVASRAISEGKSWDQVLRSVNVPETAQSMCFQYPGNRFTGKSLELKISAMNYNAAACEADEYHTVPVGKILKDLRTTARNRVSPML